MSKETDARVVIDRLLREVSWVKSQLSTEEPAAMSSGLPAKGLLHEMEQGNPLRPIQSLPRGIVMGSEYQAETYWTEARLELRAWFQRNAFSLGELYEGALRMLFDSQFPGRTRFVAHRCPRNSEQPAGRYCWRDKERTSPVPESGRCHCAEVAKGWFFAGWFFTHQCDGSTGLAIG